MSTSSTSGVDIGVAAPASTGTTQHQPIASSALVWALGSICALHGKPFDPALLLGQFAPPYNSTTLVTAARALGFEAKLGELPATALALAQAPAVLLLTSPTGLGLLVQATERDVTWIAANTQDPITQPLSDFAQHYSGSLLTLRASVRAPQDAEPDDPSASADGTSANPQAARFGFRWFVPELLKHRKVWRDVLWASLVLQLLALGLPLFTQAIIDKVIVHRTESTLIAIAMGMAIFMVATATLTWVRQYLVLHTGNRVDAVLAATVFDHLFKLPRVIFSTGPRA